MSTARTELSIALALGVVLAALSAAFGGAAKNADDPRASTFADSRRGLHALHLLLGEIGANPRRMLHPAAASDPTDRSLVVANPSETITVRETAAIVEWVGSGGRLVIVAGPPPVGALQPYEQTLLDAFGVSIRAAPAASLERVRVHDAALADGVGAIDWPAAFDVTAARPVTGTGKLEELVTAGSRCLAARVPFRDAGGEVVLVGDAVLLANASLANRDNAVLAVRLLTARAGVDFDEFHHGFRDDGGPSHLTGILAAMLVDTWPGRALLVVALAGAVFLAGAMVRLGAPDRERPPPRRALTEHADALGRIFERARARGETLRILAAGARRVAGPRAGIAASLPPPEFVRRLRSSPAPGATELAAAIERADGPRAGKDVEMAQAAASLASSRRRFLHGG